MYIVCTMCVSKYYPYPQQGTSLEIQMGRGDFREKYEAKLEFQRGGVGDPNPKTFGGRGRDIFSG